MGQQGRVSAIDLVLVGIGSGDPGHLTGEAIRALNGADLILIPTKGEEKAELADLRRALVAGLVTGGPQVAEFDLPVRDEATPDYLDRVNEWHDEIAAVWGTAIDTHLPGGGRVALMIWGDPSLYDSSLRIAERLRQAGRDLAVRVIPGITSLQLLTARHAIPLNTLGGPVQITTGRQLRDHGWPEGVGTLAVMLDGGCAFTTLPPEGVTIWWGAYLGMAQEMLDSGPLAEAGPRIVAVRAAARATHGWIMDIYLLRRG
jgi:precorrin-6A synthase